LLTRSSIWLIGDIRQRIGLDIAHGLDLNGKIVDHVMEWQNHGMATLNVAKCEIEKNFEYFPEHIKDGLRGGQTSN